jgi:hypothetical protein
MDFTHVEALKITKKSVISRNSLDETSIASSLRNIRTLNQ